MNSLVLALFPLIGVLVGAALQFGFGRRLEHRKHLQAQRSVAYADYLKAFATIARSGRSTALLIDLVDAKSRVCLYGSREVVNLMAQFEDFGSTTKSKQERALVALMIVAMRNDVGNRQEMPNRSEIEMVLFGLT